MQWPHVRNGGVNWRSKLPQILQEVRAICKTRNQLIDRSHGEGGQHIAMVIRNGYDLLPFLVLIARVADPIAPFLATVLVPSPCSTRRSRCFSSERCPTLAMNACWS